MDLEVAEPIKQCYEWQKSNMGVQLGLWNWKINYIVTTSICVVQTTWVLFERRDKDTEKKHVMILNGKIYQQNLQGKAT